MTIDENNQNEVQPWFIDDGIEGPGQRPHWLDNKFKTMADLSKSYHELEKRVGIVPDKYDFSKSKFIDPNYAPIQDLHILAKEKRVPQEFIDKMLESVDKYFDEFSIDPKEELKKLGDNAKERVQILDNWAKANLSQDSYHALVSKLQNADSIKALEELRGKMMSSNNIQIPGNNGGITNATSVDDLKIELSNNLQKYQSDENYRKDYQKRLEVAVKNTPGYVDKVGA